MKNNTPTFHKFSKEELLGLLNDSKNGDTKSFEKLASYIHNISYSYFYSKYKLKKILSVEDVEDLTQNVFVSFAKQYQSIENMENWLRRVLFLTFVNFYDKSKKNKAFELDETYYMPKPEKEFYQNLDIKTILKAMNDLSKKKQTIIKLRFWGGLKFSEIAERFGQQEATVKKMFYRSIKEIKEKLE